MTPGCGHITGVSKFGTCLLATQMLVLRNPVSGETIAAMFTGNAMQWMDSMTWSHSHSVHDACNLPMRLTVHEAKLAYTVCKAETRPHDSELCCIYLPSKHGEVSNRRYRRAMLRFMAELISMRTLMLHSCGYGQRQRKSRT